MRLYTGHEISSYTRYNDGDRDDSTYFNLFLDISVVVLIVADTFKCLIVNVPTARRQQSEGLDFLREFVASV